jgi:hypothetical protein
LSSVAAQVLTQLPCEQTRPASHTLPHVPQLLASALVFTQAAPHFERGETHEQTPLMQACSAEQLVLHEPQCCASVCELKHWPLQFICPFGQLTELVPPVPPPPPGVPLEQPNKNTWSSEAQMALELRTRLS